MLDTIDEAEDDLMMPSAQLPGVCWACKWAMNKIKKKLQNDASAVSDDHPTAKLKVLKQNVNMVYFFFHRMRLKASCFKSAIKLAF